MLLAIAGLLVPLGAGAWMLLRVEDIPEQLPPVELDPDDIVIDGVAGAPPLALEQLRGKTVFFVLVGPWTGESEEGEDLNRALNRWEFPDTTQGYIIGDAEGFGVFSDQIGELMQHFAAEVRVPLYVDFDGIFARTFALPKGHHGFVVLGPDGEIVMRKSGGVPLEQLDEVKQLLGAEEPPAGPEAPAFEIGNVRRDDCIQEPCIILALGRSVALSEIPGVEGGFEGDDEAAFEQMLDPALRNLAMARRMELGDRRGVIIGQVPDAVELVGWERIDEHPQSLTELGIEPDQAGIVLVEDGRIRLLATGLVPLYRWGVVADLLGVEVNDRKPFRG